MEKFKVEIKWSFIFVLASFLWISIAKFFDLYSTHIDMFAVYSMLFILPAVLIFIVAIQEKRRFHIGDFLFSEGFKSGMVMTVIISILSPITQCIFHTMVAPEFFENMVNYSVSNGEMSLDDARQFFNLNSYIIQSFFASMISGLITSAIVAFFLKNKSTITN